MTTITIAPYDPAWPVRFREIGTALRTALDPILGARLSRIDHIGSTSIPGIGAKPIIDVMVSVTGFYPADDPAERSYAPSPPPPEQFRHVGYRGETEDELVTAIVGVGFRWAGDWCIDRRKWLFNRRAPYLPGPLAGFDANLHLRREGCVSQQQALLFRDYLRVNDRARQRYEQVKRELAERDWTYVQEYADAKTEVVEGIIARARGGPEA